jgi:hypothetical protein
MLLIVCNSFTPTILHPKKKQGWQVVGVKFIFIGSGFYVVSFGRILYFM